MISRELRALLDQLPESGFDMVESTIRFLLMQHTAETRFSVDEGGDVPPGRSAWSIESNGLRAASHSIQQINDSALLVQPYIRSTSTIWRSRKGFLSLQIVTGYAAN